MAKADPNKLKKTKDIGSRDILFSVVLVPDSGRLYVASSDFKVHEIDTAADKPEFKAFEGEGHQSYVTSLVMSAGGLVSGSYDGKLIWWNPEDHKPVRKVDAHDRWIRQLAVSPDGKTIASVADDMVCKLWEAESGKEIRRFTDHKEMTPNHYPSMLYAVTYSADGHLIATGDKVGHVAIWDAATGEKVGEVDAPVLYTWDPRPAGIPSAASAAWRFRRTPNNSPWAGLEPSGTSTIWAAPPAWKFLIGNRKNACTKSKTTSSKASSSNSPIILGPIGSSPWEVTTAAL